MPQSVEIPQYEIRAMPQRQLPQKVWIDLDNSPHVPFFLPIIRELEGEGHHVVVTARDAFQVCALAEHHGLRCVTVGRHYGANRFKKVAGTLWRAGQLLPLILREKPDISMSHGSRPLTLVSALLGIPSMLLFDYEHARRLPFVAPALGVAPESIADPRLAHGFRHGIRSYAGLKEDVYAASFRPATRRRGSLSQPGGRVAVRRCRAVPWREAGRSYGHPAKDHQPAA
jgi:uncharacterized protein